MKKKLIGSSLKIWFHNSYNLIIAVRSAKKPRDDVLFNSHFPACFRMEIVLSEFFAVVEKPTPSCHMWKTTRSRVTLFFNVNSWFRIAWSWHSPTGASGVFVSRIISRRTARRKSPRRDERLLFTNDVSSPHFHIKIEYKLA